MPRKYIIGSLSERLEAHSELSPNGCREWTGSIDGNGYGQINVGGKLTKAHRAAWELVNGPIPEGMNACHVCDNRRCILVSHIFIGTRDDNMKDAVRKGRMHLGEKHGQSKLTDDKVREMRRLCLEGRTQSSVAKEYGVCKATMSNIVKRKIWAHVT